MRNLALILSVVVSSAAFAATPSAGVPLEVRRGFFTDTGVGGGFNLGGFDAYSNFALYLQLGVGYQIAFNEGRSIIPIGLHVGFGSNAGNCWSERDGAGNCVDPAVRAVPNDPDSAARRAIADNFTQTFINVTAGYLHRLGDGYITSRLFLGGKLVGGITLIDPKPVPLADGAQPPEGLLYGNAGVMGSFEWATMVDHFSVGLDVGYRLIFGPAINTLTFAARVQYTF